MEPSDRLKVSLADRYTIERKIGAGGRADVYLSGERFQPRIVVVLNWFDELRARVPR